MDGYIPSYYPCRARDNPPRTGDPAGKTDRGETRMPKFVIEPHFRLQEWVAEKDYFRQEGLDYEFAN